jgi:hypothetical protein
MEKWQFWVVICVVVFGILFFGYIFLQGGGTGRAISNTENNLVPQKEDCPFECCVTGDYKAKQCDQYYECINNNCKAMDSDKDGLTDKDEIQFGSNPNVYDTDADGLNDYVEKMKGTNPNNPNTDGDRYADSQDPDPTIKNTAVVDVGLTNKAWDWDLLGLLDILKDYDLNIKIATAKVDVNVLNSGNDYTTYARFDVVFKVMGTEVKRVQESVGRLEVGQSLSKHYEYDLKLGDIPQTLWQIIQQRTTSWDAEIQNTQYEKY